MHDHPDDPSGQRGPGDPAVRSAVLVTSTELEPRTFGKQVVVGGLLDHLVNRLGAGQVHVVQVGRPEVSRPHVPYRRHVVAPPTASEQLRSVAGRVVVKRRSSLQEAALYSARVGGSIARLLAEIDADLEVWDTMRVGQYAAEQAPTGRRVLYADDLFSARYATMLDRLDAGQPIGSPLGSFASLLPAPARRLADLRPAQRLLLRAERTLAARSEVAAPAHFDATLLVNPAEAADLAERSGSTHVHALAPIVDVGRGRARTFAGDPTFVFLGGLDFPPNREGLSWFLTHCRDAVLSAIPDFRLLLVGRPTDEVVPGLEEWGDHVQRLGWVDDLDAVLGGSAALLSPLWIGSGIKIKVLESLARGLPVVGTPMGVLGIEAGPEDGCLVADTPAGLADALRKTLDVAANDALSQAARRFFDARYAPAVLRRRYDEALGLAPSVAAARTT